MARTLIAVLTALALLSACGENPTDSGKLDPPSPPSHLRADKFSDGEVVLVWSASEDEDVTGYNIYRSEEDEHHFAKAGFVQGTRFSDVDLDYEKPYFYRVVAINGSGVESASLFISGRPLNNLWPAMPEDIHAEARNLSSLGYQAVIELRWEPNDEADLAGYRVYGSQFREFPEDTTVLLAQGT